MVVLKKNTILSAVPQSCIKKRISALRSRKKKKTAYYNRVLRTFYSLHFELQFHAGSVALQLTLKSHKFNICDFHKLCPHINSYNQSCLIYVNLAILCRIAHLIKHIKAIFSKSYTKINKRWCRNARCAAINDVRQTKYISSSCCCVSSSYTSTKERSKIWKFENVLFDICCVDSVLHTCVQRKAADSHVDCS